MYAPPSVQGALWSYDLSKLDLVKNRKRIITSVLNQGNNEAVAWLRSVYTDADIKDIVAHPSAGVWNVRSLNLWSIVFDLPTKPLPMRTFKQ